MLAGWSAETAPTTAADAAARGDLALFTSALWAARPRATRSGSASRSCSTRQLRERQREDDAGKIARAGAGRGRRGAPPGRNRATRSRSGGRQGRTGTAEGAHGAQNARRRGHRRGRCRAAPSRHAPDPTRPGERRRRGAAERRDTRASQRARSLEDDLRRAARRHARAPRARREQHVETRAIATRRPWPMPPPTARQLSVSLDALQRRIREAATAEAEVRRRRAGSRAGADARARSRSCRKGLVAESPAGIEAMLGTPDVVLIVDGYNVAHRAWADASAADQRERLGIAVTALSRRLGCEVVLVFDGDGSGPLPAAAPGRRAGAVLRRRPGSRRGRGPRGRGPAPAGPRGRGVVRRLGPGARRRPGRSGGRRRRPHASSSAPTSSPGPQLMVSHPLVMLAGMANRDRSRSIAATA